LASYTKWAEEFYTASTSLNDREKMLSDVSSKIEVNL
jgi:hypothetical protein